LKEPLTRVEESVKHLRYLDNFFSKNNSEYRHMNERLVAIRGYDGFLDLLYYGQDDRQMVLADVLEYMVTGRFLYEGYQEPKALLKILFYLVNQLMIQENAILDPPVRRKFLEFMERKGTQDMEHFFAGDNEEWEDRYERAKTAPNKEFDGWRKPLYRVIDSLMPKSLGTATELLVLAYILDQRLGYVVPLLTLQRMKSRRGRIIAPPDFLIIRNTKFYGLEVGAGPGGRGKVGQGNTFAAATGIPVITLLVNPPNNNASFRCPECKKLVLYCDTLIESYSKYGIRRTNEDIARVDRACPDFPNCKSALYKGDLGDGLLHYHYKCVKNEEKVKRARNEGKLFHMSLQIEGLDGFEA
jgi:hypothetical protein